MADVGPITFTIDTAHIVQSIADLASLIATIEVPSDLAERVSSELSSIIGSGGMLGDDSGDLIFRKPVNHAAGGANQVESLQLDPSDGYLVLFAALAGERKSHIFFCHGWPVLSLVGDTASMTEADGANNPVSGGLGQ